MKWTLRKNGRRMANVKVAHTVGAGDLASILASRPFYDAPPDAEQTRPEEEYPLLWRPSKTAVIARVRETLTTRGAESWHYWTDDVEEEQITQRWRWACMVVRETFPELANDPGVQEPLPATGDA